MFRHERENNVQENNPLFKGHETETPWQLSARSHSREKCILASSKLE